MLFFWAGSVLREDKKMIPGRYHDDSREAEDGHSIFLFLFDIRFGPLDISVTSSRERRHGCAGHLGSRRAALSDGHGLT